MSRVPDVSIVLPTYNRAASCRRRSTVPWTRRRLRTRTRSSSSTTTRPTTRAVSSIGVARRHPGRIRGVLERKQGVAYARNAGIGAARADIIAFFDDDVRVAPDWIETHSAESIESARRSSASEERSFRNGLRRRRRGSRATHWAPLALQDFGDAPMLLSPENPKGLISANLVVPQERSSNRIGGFSPLFQRVKDGIGSLEDDEWIRRLWKAGGRALYVPDAHRLYGGAAHASDAGLSPQVAPRPRPLLRASARCGDGSRARGDRSRRARSHVPVGARLDGRVDLDVVTGPSG